LDKLFVIEQTKNIEAPMPAQSFGGPWTERKLSVVRRYLETYAQVLRNQLFERIYVDAFAGTGDRTDKRRETLPLLDLPELEAVAKGSTRIALEVEPPFHRYIFIERAAKRVSELSTLKSEFRNRNISILNADANIAIKDTCSTTNWRTTRGVVFLDPYGLQVSWETLVAISRTQALDAWILFPTGMGLNRLLTKSGDIPKEWQDTLDRFLGTAEWRSAFYRLELTRDLFNDDRRQSVKSANTEKFEKFILSRLRAIFPLVLDRSVALTNTKGQTMYLLCFVSANPSLKVKALATRLAGWAAKA
jgi:three-Cys-motif partner protein